MKGHMTKSEGKAFKARWAAVNLAEQRELQTTSIDQKARQLAALMESAEALGGKEALTGHCPPCRCRYFDGSLIFSRSPEGRGTGSGGSAAAKNRRTIRETSSL